MGCWSRSLTKSSQLLFEQLVIFRQIVAEQRIRLREGPPAEDDFGAPARHRVESGKSLKHADRIVGAEHGHRRTETNPLGLACDSGQHYFRRRHGKIGTMMLAHAERIDANLSRRARLRSRRSAAPALARQGGRRCRRPRRQRYPGPVRSSFQYDAQAYGVDSCLEKSESAPGFMLE